VTTIAGPRPSTAPAALSRFAAQLPSASTTPDRLRILRLTLVTLAVLVGLSASIGASFAMRQTHAVSNSTEPLLVNAVTIYSSLADADATAAQAFLSGGLEPAAQTKRYDADIERASDQLAQAAARAGQDGPATDAVRTLSTQLPVYNGLVQTARANNRQGLPVGASYLSQASTLSRTQLLPAADRLFGIEQQKLSNGYGSARAHAWLVLTAMLGIALIAALIGAQLFLTRRTKRLLNVFLLAATVATVNLAVLMTGIFILQHHRLSEAERTGSNPVVVAAQARIAVLTQRGDESLTLVARGSGESHEQDFATAQAKLLGDGSHPALTADGSRAQTLEQQYVQAHKEVRALDDAGNYNGAVRLANSVSPGGAAAAFNALDDVLTSDVAANQARFTAAASHAGTGLFALLLIAPLLALVICVLSVLGIRDRLEEYR
jgi:hypothetical protein